MTTQKIESIKVTPPKKQEDIQDLSKKVLAFLVALKDIDTGLFSTWYQQGGSKAEAQEKVVQFDLEYISAIVEKEWDKKFHQLGTSFTFWTGKDDETKNAKVSFRLGITSDKKTINNLVGVFMPFENELQFDVNDPKVNEIKSLMMEIFHVDEARTT